jgi:NADH dehydrogenase/NADH:ubiquinone oxidoreductase subunit G
MSQHDNNQIGESANEIARVEESLCELRGRLSFSIFADAWLSFAIIAVFTGGFVLLVCHSAGTTSTLFERVVLGLSFALPPLSAAIARRRKLPEKNELTKILAAQNGMAVSGLLASYGEMDIKEWRDAPFSTAVPSIKITYRKRPAILAIGVLFLFGSLVVPKMLPDSVNSHGLDISGDREELEERIEMMREENIIEEKKAEELERQLKEIATQAEGDDPEKSWEALDHLSNNLDAKALEAEEETNSRLEKIELVEAVANSVMRSAESGEDDSEAAMKGMEKLLRSLKKLAPEIKG